MLELYCLRVSSCFLTFSCPAHFRVQVLLLLVSCKYLDTQTICFVAYYKSTVMDVCMFSSFRISTVGTFKDTSDYEITVEVQ